MSVRTAVDLHVFDILEAAGDSGPTTLANLARATQTEEAFLGRIVRYLVSIGAIIEEGDEGYVLGKVGKAFATKRGVSAAKFL